MLVPETTIGDEIVPAQWVPKDPSLYSDSEKEKIAMKKEGNEKEEFYTLEEVDDLEKQSMAYIARKFSNIRFKKNKAFKPRQYTCTSSNNTGSKAPYKGGYKTGYVHISKIRCYNCNNLGHFSNECKKSKQVKNDKDYLKLEAMYQALLKKRQEKAYISEGKCWDDSDNDEKSTKYANLALMIRMKLVHQ